MKLEISGNKMESCNYVNQDNSKYPISRHGTLAQWYLEEGGITAERHVT